jgi:ribosome-associated protein
MNDDERAARLTEKRRGPKSTGGASTSGRPKISSSHAGRAHEGHAPARPTRKGSAPPGPRPRRGPPPAPPGPRVRKARAASAGAGQGASIASDEARALAIAIATAALDKKALSVEVLDVAGKVDYADFLVLMTGRSDRQVQAIAQGIEDALRKQGRRPQAVEGLPHATWVLMDFIDVVVHVFQDDARGAYDLDGLWMDARRIPVPIPEEER